MVFKVWGPLSHSRVLDSIKPWLNVPHCVWLKGPPVVLFWDEQSYQVN